MDVVRLRGHVIRRDIHTLIHVRAGLVLLVQMAIQDRHLKDVVVVQLQERVMLAVLLHINTPVQEQDILEEVVAHAMGSTRLVVVQAVISGMVALV